MTARPRIGLSSCFDHANPDRPLFSGKTLLYVEQCMVEWTASEGALAYPIPTTTGSSSLVVLDYVDDLDGLVLHGGADVAPASYGQEAHCPEWSGDAVRDAYELALVDAFLTAGKPVLGICRGLQILNVCLGGTLHQDLVADGTTTEHHRDATLYDHLFHDIDVLVGTGLAATVGTGRQRVNSIHHQGIDRLGQGLSVEARSVDGIIEAVRLDGGQFAAAVQWHPEFFDIEDPSLLDNGPILREFVTQTVAGGSGS